MITEIGIAAGEIWQYLEKYSETTLSKIIEATKRDRDTILMSLGWLAREGHISIKKVGDEYNTKDGSIGAGGFSGAGPAGHVRPVHHRAGRLGLGGRSPGGVPDPLRLRVP